MGDDYDAELAEAGRLGGEDGRHAVHLAESGETVIADLRQFGQAPKACAMGWDAWDQYQRVFLATLNQQGWEWVPTDDGAEMRSGKVVPK